MLVLLLALLIVRRPDHAASPPCSISATSPSFLTLPTPLLPNSVTRCIAFWATSAHHTAVHRGGDAVIWGAVSAARAPLFGAEPPSGLAANHENRPKPSSN